MARMLYRLLRLANFFAGASEVTVRRAFGNAAMLSHLQRQIHSELKKPLSYVLPLTGRAMAPALNAAAAADDAVHDRLVIRRLSGTAQAFLNRVHVDDVVVVRDPGDARRKYVRRVAGLPGDELVSDAPGAAPRRVPGGHCWVVRDNDAAAAAPDSRTFGPLALQLVLGRVMYAIRSATDHGRVASSPYAMASDAIVLAQEPIAPHLHDAPPPPPPPPQQ